LHPEGYSAECGFVIKSGHFCTASPAATNVTLKLQVALHELGHTLSYVHPEDPMAAGAVTMPEYIPGTASGTGYSTVMHAAFGEPGITSLTSDDILSRNKFFGGPTCQVSPP
jgi:hypothetical protein